MTMRIIVTICVVFLNCIISNMMMNNATNYLLMQLISLTILTLLLLLIVITQVIK